jgi:glycosyltransferase involved in cell wall biosynthesis
MKITIVTPPPNLSGGIRVVAIHAAALQRLGHQVQIVHPAASQPTASQRLLHAFNRRWRGAGVAPGEPAASHFDGLDVPRVLLPASRKPSAEQFPDADVIVATWWETAEWVSALPPSKGAKAYFVQGHEIFDYLPKDRVRATYRLPLHKITVSKWLVDLMAREYGDTEVSLAQNGVDLDRFSALGRQMPAVPTVGMIASEEAFKGTGVAVAAANLARKRLPNLRLVTFGASDRRPSMLPAWAEYHARPAQKLIPELYAQCGAWLFASRSEGFGLPLLEALSCGTPVVGTGAGAAPELLSGGGGVLVPFDDPDAMSDAIVQICSSPTPVWNEIAKAARATAEAHPWHRSTKEFEAGLLRALQGRDSTLKGTYSAEASDGELRRSSFHAG